MNRLRKVAHFLIYANLITGFLSALYMVFVVYRVPGHFGPLWNSALRVPHEFIVQRRLYALEAWIIFGFLATYFALTDARDRK